MGDGTHSRADRPAVVVIASLLVLAELLLSLVAALTDADSGEGLVGLDDD